MNVPRFLWNFKLACGTLRVKDKLKKKLLFDIVYIDLLNWQNHAGQFKNFLKL